MKPEVCKVLWCISEFINTTVVLAGINEERPLSQVLSFCDLRVHSLVIKTLGG